jgi:hypothetical protein
LSRTLNVSVDIINRTEGHEGGRKVALIESFSRRFHYQGIPLLVMILPWSGDQDPKSIEDRNIVIQHLRRAGIAHFSVDLPRRPNGSLEGRRFLVGTHPNREYNRLLVGQLTQFLASHPEFGINVS